jgi:hypothetical protein
LPSWPLAGRVVPEGKWAAYSKELIELLVAAGIAREQAEMYCRIYLEECSDMTQPTNKGTLMNAEALVKLIEEMVDLKIQQQAQANLKASPETARFLEEKRVTDRRRLEQIKAELVRLLSG